VTILVGGYVPAKRCSGYATSGAKALMSWYLGAYADDGAANLGIYVCKSIAGTATTSLHGEGRACDLGSTPYRHLPFMDDVMDALVAHSKELGIQCVIHDDKIWSSSYPYAGWRNYSGSDPHRGHGHAELTPWAAVNLTVPLINRVLGTTVVRPTPPPPKPTTPPVDWTRRLIMALPELKEGIGRKGAHNEDVQTMQQLLQARGYRAGQGAGGADGIFGPGTERDLIAFQKAVKIKADGICGKLTWAHLLRQPKAVA
jgi:hypothetical protein